MRCLRTRVHACRRAALLRAEPSAAPDGRGHDRLGRARGRHCHRDRHRPPKTLLAVPGRTRHGHIKASAKVTGKLYRIATGNGREAVTDAIFWLKVTSGMAGPSRCARVPD